MSSTFNVGRPPERPIFLIISSISSEITNQFDLEVDGHLFYRAQWLDFKFDANERVYLMKMIIIPYLVHLGDAHIFQCGVPNFNSFTMKLGQYLHIYLLYRAQWLDFEFVSNKRVY
jgi:hypothetical protein